MSTRWYLWVAIISVMVGVLSLFNNYPGFLYTDSFIRWDQAESIVEGKYIGGNFLTIAPSLLYSLILYITGNPSAYSFLQASVLSFMFVGLISASAGQKRKGLGICLALLLYLCTPQLLAYGLTHAPGVGVAIAVVVMTTVFMSFHIINISYVNCLLLIALTSLICFGFRQNSLVLLPFFLLIICFFTRFSKPQKLWLSCTLMVMATFTALLPNIMNWKTSNQLAKSIAWEMACLVKEGGDELAIKDLSSIGITDKAINNVHCSNVLSLAGPRLNTSDDVKRVYSMYGRFITEEPAEFFFNKLRVWSRVLGFSGPLEVTEVINEWPKLSEYGGYEQTERRSMFVRYYHSFHQQFPVFRYPFFLVLVTSLLISIALYRHPRRNASRLGLALFVIATAYYLSFFLVAQRHEVRYFFPTAYVYFIVIGMSLSIILGSIDFSKLNWIISANGIAPEKIGARLLSVMLAAPVVWVLSVALMPRLSALFVPTNFSIQASPLTDANWSGGVALKGNRDVILVEATQENIAHLRLLGQQGSISVEGVNRAVKNVRIDKHWIHLFVAGEELDPNVWGHPNEIVISLH